MENHSKPPLRVLQVSYTLKTGGLETIIRDLARQGPEHGYLCQAAALIEMGEVGRAMEAEGSPVHFLGKREGLDWSMVFKLASLVRREKIDLLHAHNEGPGLYAGLASWLCRRPMLLTRHGQSFGMDSLWVRRAAGFMSRYTACVSRAVEAMSLEQDRLSPQKVRLIHNGVDTARFAPLPQEERLAMRAELGLEPTAPLVISLGRLAPEKDYPSLIKAVAKVEGARLALVGQGPVQGELEELIQSMGLGERVILTGLREDVARLLGAADCFALSSLTEGVSMALLEAMACGLPAVVTDVGGSPDVVIDGQCGYLVPASDVEALSSALAKVLKNQEQSRAMAQAARQRIQESFSLEAMAASYADLYQRLVRR